MKIAVLGAGEMGAAHARIYAGPLKKQVELESVLSRSLGKARKLAAVVGARPTANPDDILSDETIDAVDICLPSASHRRFAVRALDQGKHVFCETPMALTLRDADAMIAAARRNRRLLAVAQVMRYVAPYVRAHAEAASGRFGKPRVLVARRLSRPYWLRRPRPFRAYGEPITELSIHDIDVANWFLGDPVSVLASGIRGPSGVPEQTFIAITHRRGHGFVEGSAMMPPGFAFTTALRVQCERGVFDLMGQFLGGPIPKEQFIVYSEAGLKRLPIRGKDPYELECRDFVRAVAGRRNSIALSARWERDALRVILAAKQSIRTQRPVRL
jgi:UDP-N-acetylglucosamine 3-dehydrogenase